MPIERPDRPRRAKWATTALIWALPMGLIQGGSATAACPHDDRSLALLIANLSGDESTEIRAAAASLLGCVGDGQAIEPLAAAVTQPDAMIRLAAVDALARFGAKDQPDGDQPLRLMTGRRPVASPPPTAALSRVAAADRVIDRLGSILDDPAPGQPDDDWSRSDAAWALGRLGSSTATYYLSRALSDRDNLVRAESARALMRLGDGRGLPVLAQHLADWFYGPRILPILRHAGWRPQTDADQIHLWVSHRDRAPLVRRWKSTKSVLIADLHSRFALSALYAAIAIGRADFIPEATAALVNGGSRAMAEAFLNCGQPDLKQAGESWAKARGYTILAGPGDPPVSWGEM